MFFVNSKQYTVNCIPPLNQNKKEKMLLNRITNYRDDFPVRLRHAFGAAGITTIDDHESLATKLGVSAGAVQNWLRGLNKPNAQNLERLCAEVDYKKSFFTQTKEREVEEPSNQDKRMNRWRLINIEKNTIMTGGVLFYDQAAKLIILRIGEEK